MNCAALAEGHLLSEGGCRTGKASPSRASSMKTQAKRRFRYARRMCFGVIAQPTGRGGPVAASEKLFWSRPCPNRNQLPALSLRGQAPALTERAPPLAWPERVAAGATCSLFARTRPERLLAAPAKNHIPQYQDVSLRFVSMEFIHLNHQVVGTIALFPDRSVTERFRPSDGRECTGECTNKGGCGGEEGIRTLDTR